MWTGGRTPRLLAVFFSVLAAAGAGCLETGPPGEFREDPAADPDLIRFYEDLGAGREARFETTHGPVRLLLYEALMPATTARFAELVAAGYYDGTEVHRVVARFVVQGGDQSGTGLLGTGENIRHERHEDLRFGTGSLGLARLLDPDSGDAQWFITLTPQPHLHDPSSDTAELWGTYALFGQVVEGMDAVRAMGGVMTIPGLDRPLDPPVVLRAGLHAPPHDVELLQLPTTVQPRAVLGDHGYDLEHPLHLFAGHRFPLAVHLRPGEDADAPPAEVHVRFEGRFPVRASETLVGLEEVVLRSVPGDPWSFAGELSLMRAGEWSVQVRAGADTDRTHTVQVEPWHDDYARFTGSD